MVHIAAISAIWPHWKEVVKPPPTTHSRQIEATELGYYLNIVIHVADLLSLFIRSVQVSRKLKMHSSSFRRRHLFFLCSETGVCLAVGADGTQIHTDVARLHTLHCESAAAIHSLVG